MTSRRKYLAIATVIAAAAVVYGLADPSVAGWMPKCPFKALTGYSCPGCGSQRLIHSLLHLRFYDAFRYNALLFVALPYLVVLVYASATRVRHQRLYLALNGRWGIITPFVVILSWWVFRNIIGW